MGLEAFFAYLNVNIFSLKFTMVHDKNSLDFLDLTIFRGPDDKIFSKLFRKRTACNSLLRADSSHPPRLVWGIPKGQYMRIKRNCAIDQYLEEEAPIGFYPKGTDEKALRRHNNLPRAAHANYYYFKVKLNRILVVSGLLPNLANKLKMFILF